MKALWFSSLAWHKNKKYPHEVDGPGAVSGSIFQQSMIQGLERCGVDVDIINDYPIRYKKYFRGYEWSHNGKNADVAISKINMKILSLITKTISLLKSIKNKQVSKKYDVAISYLIHTPYLLGLWFSKILNPKLKTILICPDLPGYMDMSLNNKPIKKIAKMIDGLLINNIIRKVDGFVLFSEAMQSKLPIEGKPAIVIEGVFNGASLNFKKVNKRKAIMHAGTLHRNIGIENILDAFMEIEDNELEFWIFGDGDLKNYIINKATEDKRIKYRGFVSREELFEYEKQASVLINARNPNDEFTIYSFPSKTFEYMASGTPFLTTILKGIPKDYLPYLHLIEDNNPSTIKTAIENILQNSEITNEEFGKQAREFVINYKNNEIQAKKMIKLIDDLM